MNIKKLVTFFLISPSLPVLAQLHVSPLMTDQMVLQQNTDATIWGEDNPHQSISLESSWGGHYTTKADANGHWQFKIATPSAVRSQQLKINGSSEVVINDISIGEVWICSGQSNIEISLAGNVNQPIFGSNEAILNANNPDLRFFKVNKNPSPVPIEKVEGQWVSSTPVTARSFSATCYFFGKKLQETLEVPVGLIHSAWGGSSAEAWTPKQALSSYELTPPENNLLKSRIQTTPSVLFNGMLHPLRHYTIKGFTWYQGENNRPRAYKYTKLMQLMVGAWRQAWDNETLPFYYVQIAPFGVNHKDKNGALLREAQLNAMANIAHSGMVSTLDIGRCNSIHPPQKQEVGDRLAYWALAKDYQIPAIEFSGPVYKAMEIKNGKAYIQFDYAELGLYSYDETLTGFEIAGADKQFYPAKASISKTSPLTVWSDQVKEPVAVRYGFENCPKASLFNTFGLPASSFRTDQW